MADPVYYVAKRFQTLENAREYLKATHPNSSEWTVLAVAGQPALSLDGKTALPSYLKPRGSR